jgi:hypothetical protein
MSERNAFLITGLFVKRTKARRQTGPARLMQPFRVTPGICQALQMKNLGKLRHSAQNQIAPNLQLAIGLSLI